jgi:hypothetical protein
MNFSQGWPARELNWWSWQRAFLGRKVGQTSADGQALIGRLEVELSIQATRQALVPVRETEEARHIGNRGHR